MADPTLLTRQFRDRYGRDPQLYRAPGRVNLIGEHTDYNVGFVMPVAIDFACWVAIAARADRFVRFASTEFADEIEVPLDDKSAPRHLWSDYPEGVTRQLEELGVQLRGADVLVSSDVPIGSGLSSSAALEVASAFALLGNSGVTLDRARIALLCQKAENEFVGARCGIMDQFISANGHAGRALMLDCRTLQFRLLPIPDEVRIIVCNTMVKHSIAGGEYNDRRQQCEQGVRQLRKESPGIKALRDVSMSDLDRYSYLLPRLILMRCRHVISENARVLAAAAALEEHDLQKFGALMAESNASLRDDYEVSCPELDIMVEIASSVDGVIGARMTGGGFGGCTVNLVHRDFAEAFRREVSQRYEKRTGKTPEVYISKASEGAGAYEASAPSD